MLETNTFSLRSKKQKWGYGLKILVARMLWGYGKENLIETLRQAGVLQGDILMVHSSWRVTSGFRGDVNDFVDALMQTVGPNGTLAMMSMAYNGISSYEYLKTGRPFNVRRSVSMVGLPTELFRRRHGVIRGLHPTHSVAAWGAKAQWLVAEQGKELSPFGEQSPFARLAEANGKILLYDVPFNTMTFEHYLEHLIQDNLPLPLYYPVPFLGLVVDYEGNTHQIVTLVLNKKLNQLRQSHLLEGELHRTGALKSFRVGRANVILGQARDLVDSVQNMIRENKGFHIQHSGELEN